MYSSMVLARLIGPFIIVIGIAVLFNRKVLLRVAEDFFKNSALVYVSGLVTFSAGLAIVSFHNVWTADWRVIITLFGWSSLIKGASLVILPEAMSKMTARFIKNIKFIAIPWMIMLILGIFLMIKGYS